MIGKQRGHIQERSGADGWLPALFSHKREQARAEHVPDFTGPPVPGNRSGPRLFSALRVLETLAGAGLPVLLAFLLAIIASQEAALLQGATPIRILREQ